MTLAPERRPGSVLLRRGPLLSVVVVALVSAVVLLLPAFVGDPLAAAGDLFEPPSPTHPFGTDDIGRDIATRVLIGARSTILAAATVVLGAAAIGVALGLFAGLTRIAWIDAVLSRIFDALLALPSFLSALALAAILGPSMQSLVTALIAVWWPSYARVTHAEVRRLLGRTHTEAAAHVGVTPVRRAVLYILPGALTPLIVLMTSDLGAVILTMAGLQFIGLGTPPPAPELGGMMQRGLPYLFDAWWVALAPGIVITLLAVASMLGGDALQPGRRDAKGMHR